MKIFCIGRNYSEHAKELGNDIPTQPMIFMKPDTALLLKNRPFFYPEFSKDIHYECEVVLKIGKVGRHIEPRFALAYIEEITLGIDFTARDIQQQCKADGHPWEIAKAFDQSAVLGEMKPYADYQGRPLAFQLHLNGKQVQSGNTQDMMFDFAQIISFISTRFTFKMGDLIYTGTPAGVGPIQIGDHLEGFLEGEKMFETLVK